MTGVQIEYLLGIFFFINSITFPGGKFNADWFKFIAGALLIIAAIFGISPAR